MPRKAPPRPPSRRRGRPQEGPPRLRVLRRQHTLVYGMRLIRDRVLEEGPHEQVPLERAGPAETLTLHQITGDADEIRRRLQESLDAFFEIYAEEPD